MPARPIDRGEFEELVEFVENLLGPPRLRKLNSRYERAIQLGDKKYVPHRLIHNYRAVRNSLDTMLDTPPSGDFIAMMELGLFRTLVEAFRNDPVWPEIRPELNSTGSFVHMMSLLQFVHMQRARGTNIALLPTNNDGSKTADAVMYTPLNDRIDVEVKAPELLWAPNDLTAEQAEKVVANAWKKSRRQIRNGPSILLIGGLFVPRRFLALLEEAAMTFLERKKNRHVGHIQINSITILVKDPFLTDEQNFTVGPKTTLASQIIIHIARNPHYQGIVEFRESNREIPEYSRSEEGYEFTINASKDPE